MKVFISTSAEKIDENIESCREIIRVVKKLGHKITRDWTEQAYKLKLERYHYLDDELKIIFQDNIKALKESDVVILESTAHTFNIGYLAAKSVSMQKPLLILKRDSLDKKTFLIGESITLKCIETFQDLTDIEPIITSFLNENTDSKNSSRFNMFIGRNISNFLKRKSEASGKSKAQVVRDILEDYISKQL